MSRWEGIEEFVTVVDYGTFSAAARVLGVSKSHISQQVSRLEGRLGSRLLHRTTRKTSLTETGLIFYRQCQQVMEDLEAAERSVSQAQQLVKGQLKICSPHWLGEVLLIPAIAEFMRIHPELEVRLEISSRKVDLIDGDFDVAIQVGVRNDVNVVNQKLAATRFFVVASPDYLQNRPAIKSPQDIHLHQTLLFEDRGFSKPWKLINPTNQRDESLRVKSHWRSNSGHALRAAAKQGLGLAYLPDYYLVDDVESGQLVVLIPEWTTLIRHIVAIYQHKENVSTKIKLFTEFLKGYFDREQHRLNLFGSVKGL